MTKKLPNALDMLKLEPDVFWLEVRKVYCEKPWPHRFFYGYNGHYMCSQCPTVHASVELYPDGKHFDPGAVGSCPVPPPLTEAPEVVARKLRDEAVLASTEALGHAIYAVQQVIGGDASNWASQWWHGVLATPEQQITCYLVARGLWQVEAEGDPK